MCDFFDCQEKKEEKKTLAMRIELLHCCPSKRFLCSTHRTDLSSIFFSPIFQLRLSIPDFYLLFLLLSLSLSLFLFLFLFLLMSSLPLMSLSSYFYSRFFAVLLLHALVNDRPVLNNTFVFHNSVMRKKTGAFDAPCEYRGFTMRWYS